MIIDDIMDEYDKSSDLLFKKIPFFSLILPEFIKKQFTQITSEFTVKETLTFVREYNNLYKKIDDITKNYGSIIKDFFYAKVKEIYEVPDYIKFNEEEMEHPENEKTDMEEIDDEDADEDMFDMLQDEVGHYVIKNTLLVGAVFINQLKIFELIKDDLNNLQLHMFEDINKFLKYSILYAMSDIPTKDMSFPIAGSEEINLENPDENKNAQNINVTIKGMNVIIVCHEMLKAIFDILSEKSFLTDNIKDSVYKQKYLRKVCNNYYIEKWTWFFGIYMWSELIEKKYKEEKESYFKYVSNIFGTEYSKLLDFLMSK